jgi:hypothetical protein
MTDPIATQSCACGWRRPLIAVTLASGQPPTEEIRLRYDCPGCGHVHLAGEIPLGTALESSRAHALASAQEPRPIRTIAITPSDDGTLTPDALEELLRWLKNTSVALGGHRYRIAVTLEPDG